MNMYDLKAKGNNKKNKPLAYSFNLSLRSYLATNVRFVFLSVGDN